MADCTLCNTPVLTRQNIRIVPAMENAEHESGFALGEPLRFHIRHMPGAVSAHIYGMGAGIGDAASYKVGYNPPWQITDGQIVNDFVENLQLAEALTVVRDRVFEWFKSFPRDTIVRAAAAGACADDSALGDMIELFAVKEIDELYEKCLTHNTIERLQAVVAQTKAAADAA